MPISLQSDAVLPQGHILVDGQRVASFSTTGGLSASSVRAESIGGTAGQFLVPVGAVMAFTTSTAPSGWLKLNGAELVRSDFSALWTFASNSGNLVSEATWTATNQGSFSTGNTTTTFRLPDLRGEFVRGWADSGTIDSGRSFGSTQTDEFKSHTHNVNNQTAEGPQWLGFSRNDLNPSAPNDGTAQVAGGIGNDRIFSIVNTGGSETRPRNIALLYCIKY